MTIQKFHFALNQSDNMLLQLLNGVRQMNGVRNFREWSYWTNV